MNIAPASNKRITANRLMSPSTLYRSISANPDANDLNAVTKRSPKRSVSYPALGARNTLNDSAIDRAPKIVVNDMFRLCAISGDRIA